MSSTARLAETKRAAHSASAALDRVYARPRYEPSEVFTRMVSPSRMNCGT